MRTRKIEPRDAVAWAAMRHALWPHADADELARECAAFFVRPHLIETVFVAAEADGTLVGFVELSLRSHAQSCDSSPVPYIEGWYVATAARKSGVGRALIDAAERWAIDGGYPEIASDAQLDNRASHAAHAALGFEETARNVHFRKTLPRR